MQILIVQDSDFAGYLEDSKSTSGGTSCIFGSHTFVHFSFAQFYRSWKYFSGVRMDGIPDLWDLVIEAFHSSPNQFDNTKDQVRGNSSRNTTSDEHIQNQTKVPTQHDNLIWAMLIMSRRTRSFPDLARCCTFLRITKPWLKWSSKSRRPRVRHVSRTHRVALHWLFDRNHLDPKIQVKYVDSKHQFADVLTEGNLTRDGTIFFMCSTATISAHLAGLRISAWPAALKRWRRSCKNMKGEDRIVAKSKPTTMNLCLRCLAKFFNCAESSCVEKPGDTQSTFVEQIGQVQGNLTHENSIKTQRRVLKDDNKDAVLDVGTKKLVATEEDQEHLIFSEGATSTRKLIASRNSETEGSDKFWQKSTNFVPHLENIFSIVRQRYGLGPEDQVKHLAVNAAIWGIFLSVTLQGAVQFGIYYTENLRSTKNQPKKSLRQWFQVTLITVQTEISGFTTIRWQQLVERDDSADWQSC